MGVRYRHDKETATEHAELVTVKYKRDRENTIEQSELVTDKYSSDRRITQTKDLYKEE